MVGNDQVKGFILIGNPSTVKYPKCETPVLRADGTSGITKHPGRKIRKCNRDFRRQEGHILSPQSTVPTAQFQDFHVWVDVALGVYPGKPALAVAGVKAVEVDPGGNIGRVLILVFHALFHACQVDQVQHLIPVNGVAGTDSIGGILDGFFHQLHLFDAVTDQFQLDVQGILHKVIVGVVNGHLPNIIQGKAQVLQKQDLGKPCEICICVESCTGFCHIGGFEDILFVIISDGPQGHMSHPREFSGRVVAVFFHRETFLFVFDSAATQKLFLRNIIADWRVFEKCFLQIGASGLLEWRDTPGGIHDSCLLFAGGYVMVDTCLNAHRHSHKSLSGSSAVIFPKYNSIEDDQNAGTGGT